MKNYSAELVPVHKINAQYAKLKPIKGSSKCPNVFSQISVHQLNNKKISHQCCWDTSGKAQKKLKRYEKLTFESAQIVHQTTQRFIYSIWTIHRSSISVKYCMLRKKFYN